LRETKILGRHDIDRGRDLAERQRKVIAALISELSENPLLGDPPLFPEYTPCDYFVEKHIGRRIHVTFYYDVERHLGKTTVRVRAVRIGMKM